MLNQLINNSTVGFKWGVRASAFVVVFMLAVANLIIKENPNAIDRNKPKPDFKGVFTDWPFNVVVFG
jgi:hypothetical protein